MPQSQRLAGGGRAYDVTTFTDPAAALDFAAHVRSQIALVDLQIPDADAAGLLAELGRVCPLIRVVGMAAFPEVPQVLAAIRA